MKDRSLLYLLLSRIRQMDVWQSNLEFADELKSSLKVSQENDRFLITWHQADKEFSHDVPGDMFQFYVRGDVEKASGTGLRRMNWDQAEKILLQIAEISGIRVEQRFRPDVLGTSVAVDRVDTHPQIVIVVLGLLVSVVALAAAGPRFAVWSGGLAIALCYLAAFHRYTLLQWPVHWIELVVVAAGALLPCYLMFNPAPAALLAIVLVLMTNAELRGSRASLLEWAIPAALAGTLVFAIGRLGWIPVIVISIFALAIGKVLPARFSRPAMFTVVVASAAVAVTATFVPLETPHEVSQLTLMASTINYLLVAIFAIYATLGWIVGQQFLIFPWLGNAIIFATFAIFSFANNMGAGELSALGFAGYALFAVARLLRALVKTRRRSPVKDGGAR